MVEPISDNDLTRLRLDADHNLLRTLASMDVGTLRSILARLDAAEAERDRLRAEAERLTNNRDMWRGQCERQAATLTEATWRPIETAPKDGAWVLLTGYGYDTPPARWVTCGYTRGGGGWMEIGDGTVLYPPTHWRPLPPPPGAAP